MKLRAEVNERECDVTLEVTGHAVLADVDGRTYQLEVHQSGNDGYLIFENEKIFECRVNPHHGSRDVFDVTLKGKTQAVTISDPRRLRTDEDSDRHHHGSAEVTAPMPGKVVRVLVQVGEQVEAGAGLIVVEAMKMQNEMKSPRAGGVVSINVAEGDTVESGTLLAVIE